MSKHTPKPWLGRPYNDPVGICGCDEVGLQIAFVTSPDEKRRDELKANARLIAAAPELLEELKKARAEIWRLLDAKGIEPKQAREWPEIVSADAAIAKATGGEE
jgi:hypothetical protein